MNAGLEERFWARVEKGPGCWLWSGSRDPRGYGTLSVDGRTKRATHVSVRIATGKWPEPGLMACHHCDNPPCVNPEHLFVGTSHDNMRDCVRKGRNPKGETHGFSKLTEKAVTEARGRCANGEPMMRLAEEYGVDPSTMNQALEGTTWAHVSQPTVKSLPPRGERHGSAKLTPEDVLAIRAAGISQRTLARQYGVSQPTICDIRNGKLWGHVE